MSVHVGVAKDAKGRRCIHCKKPPTEGHYTRCPSAQLELIPHCDHCGMARGEHLEQCPRWWKPRGR